MKKLFGVNIGIGTKLLFLSGVFLLLGAFLLTKGDMSVWFAAKAIYALGLALFLFDK